MNVRNRALIYFTLGVTFLLPFGTAAQGNPAYTLDFDPQAQVGETNYDDPLKTYTQLGDADPAAIVFTIVNTALLFLGLITLVLIIVAGFLWLTAAGKEEQITKAKDILKGAILGLVVVLASYGLSQYIFTAIRIATQGA